MPEDKISTNPGNRSHNPLLRFLVRHRRNASILVQIFIVVSMIGFSVETVPNNPEWLVRTLYGIEVLCVSVFTTEYIVRILLAKDRLKFLFSFYGLVDLLAILPFYLSLSMDLRAIRAVRLLRLVRLLKLTRYNAAAQRFHRAVVLAREEIALFLGFTCIMLFISAVGIYYFEHDAQPEVFASVFHALWWAVVTFTTVGYGDAYPITLGGRIFTFLVLILGLGVIAVPSGIVTSALQQARQELGDRDRQRKDDRDS